MNVDCGDCPNVTSGCTGQCMKANRTYKPLPGQMELATVIDHKQSKSSYSLQLDLEALMAIDPPRWGECTRNPAGVRLAKMLSQYDDSPSSQLWADIQRLAREILK